MDRTLIYVVAQAVTYVVFGILGTVLFVLHRKGERNADRISTVDREVAGLGERFIGRGELEAHRVENRGDHERIFGKLEGIAETTAELAGEVRRMNGGSGPPTKP